MNATRPRTATPEMPLEFFPVGYTWDDPQFGELQARTVVAACDGATACAHLKSKFRHLKRVWLILPDAQQPEPFTARRHCIAAEQPAIIHA